MANSDPYPVEIQRDDQGAMRISWNDGHSCRYDYNKLRQACPCATCRDATVQQQQDPFHIVTTDVTAVTPVHLSTVGHYALNIEWSDGHRTGIYPWALLRDLCETR